MGPRRMSAVAAALVVLCLGGAVAAVYTTGVMLGTRIAPVADPPADQDSAAPDGTSSARPALPRSSLPDRVERRLRPRTAAPPGAGSVPDDVPINFGPGDLDATLGPYPGVWPYGTWPEVRDHVERGDQSFTTPETTARRFAQEVVGVRGVRLGTQRVARNDALIEVRTEMGSTTVVLARPDLGEGVDEPWGVVSASGDLALSAGSAGPGRVGAVVRGPGPSVVAVHDRIGWRGVARSVAGSASLRVGPGPAVPAAVVAVAGDPRDPASFAVARVEIGPGAPSPSPPASASVAAAEMAARVAAGDVSGVWNGLDGGARRAVLDWRGLAARWDALAAHVAPLGRGTMSVTRVTSAGVPLDVVSAPSPGGGAVASVFRSTARGSLLESLGAPSVRWELTGDAPPTLTVRGPTRPSAVVIDGRTVAGGATGENGLSVSLAEVAAGPHVVVAVFLGDQASAAATVVTTAEMTAAEPAPPAPAPEGPPTSTTTEPMAPEPDPEDATRSPPTTTEPA